MASFLLHISRAGTPTFEKNAQLRRRYPLGFLATNETKYLNPDYLETALLS
jgi:hypothetical protein